MEIYTPVEILLLSLAVWRLSSLLVNEDGPAMLFDRIRGLAIRLKIDGAFACVWCMSVWVAFGFLLGLHYIPAVTQVLIVGLALSAGAVLVHIIIERIGDNAEG